MPKPFANQVITQRHKRVFLQEGGPSAANRLLYGGQDGQYMAISGVSNPQRGDINPIRVHDPRRPGSYKIIGRTVDPADLPEAEVMMYERHGAIPRALGRRDCPFNLYVPTGDCKDLSDFIGGWSDYVEIYSQALATDVDLGDRATFDSDEAIEDSISVTLAAIYAIGRIGFGEQAAAAVDREAVDVVYGTAVLCGDCGPQNDGTRWAYAITKSSGGGSPGLPGEVQYTVTGGAVWTSLPIDGIGATADPTAIDIVGQYLVVVVASENAYYYAEIDSDTGIPGSFVKVTSGFVASKLPRDLYVASPREVFFCADGGYIYKATDITSGVDVLHDGSATTSDLKRIHGAEDALVAVGASGTVLRSITRGATWATTNYGLSGTLQAVWVFDERSIWVGSGSGVVSYTLDGGKTAWTAKAVTSGTPTAIYDIVFATPEVGYVAYAISGPTGKIASTWDGGNTWTGSAPRLNALPTFDYPGRIAVPTTDSDFTTNANHLMIAGLGGNGTDGILISGAATIL